MSKHFEITPKTRVFAENDACDCFILTNNQVVTFDDLQITDLGCHVNMVTETMSQELPILVLTKQEYFGKVKTKIDLEKVKRFRHIG